MNKARDIGRVLIGFGVLLAAGASGWWLFQPDDHKAAADRPFRHFTSCNEARLAGYGSMYEGEPSYRPELDEDGDGVACEPWRGGRGWSRGRP